MGNVEKIEQEIEMLDKNELMTLRQWFHEYDTQIWDEQIESDAKSGKLGKLADEAIAEFLSGKATEL